MCIGIPKKIVALDGVDGEFAWVEGVDGVGREFISLMLLEPQQVGSWVLTSLGIAREELSVDEAATINDALAALVDSLDGNYDPDRHFADLVRH